MRSSPIDKGLDPLSTMSTPPFVLPPPRDANDPANFILYPPMNAALPEKSGLLKPKLSAGVAKPEAAAAVSPSLQTRPVVLNPPPAAVAPQPSRDESLTSLKGFKFSFDSAASRISKYAQSAAFQIKAMAQTAANEAKLSLLAAEVPMDVFEVVPRRSPIPPKWIEAFWQTPKNALLYRPSDTLFVLDDNENIEYSFPRAAFVSDVRLTNDSVKPSPSLFGTGGEMAAIGNEYVVNTEATPPPYVIGRAIMTDYRLFFDPLVVDTSSYTQRWLIESGLISIDWLEIESYSVCFRPQISPSSSPDKIPTKEMLGGDGEIEAGHCFLDLTLKCGSTVCLVLHSMDCLPLLEPAEAIGPIADSLSHLIEKHLRPQSLVNCGCFRRSNVDENHLAVFDPVKEYSRYCVSGEILNDAAFHLADFNRHFTLCPTYPALLPLPRAMNESAVSSVAEFRTRGRIPILAWRDSKTSASLWRSSQPQSAFSRSVEDEFMVCEAIRLTLDESRQTLIFDARPFVNAVVNKFTGAGFEDVESYGNCKLEFASIENIQKVSDSHAAVVKAIHKENNSFKTVEFKSSEGARELQDIIIEVEWCQPSNVMSKVYNSGWLDHILTLLRAASRIARHLSQGQVVLVHCSDGWDRTAQLSALAQLLIDPYFRSLQGFCTLIEKEFVWMGHKFGTRLGHPVWIDRGTETEDTGNKKNVPKKQISPVFVQWLECVWQIQQQFPNDFEFGERLLVGLASCVHASKFGDFMFDNEAERLRLRQRGIVWSSIWKWIVDNKATLLGTLSSYELLPDACAKSTSRVLPLNTHVCAMRFWEAYWLRNRPRRMQP